MSPTAPVRTLEEIARRGGEILERQVRPGLRPENEGMFVAIDVDTGDHELHEDDYAAVTRLRSRRPAGEIWLGRIGQPAAYRTRHQR